MQIKLTPNINEVIDFSLKENEIFLTLEEEKEIEIELNKIGNPKDNIQIISRNPEIVTTQNNKVISKSPGSTEIEVKVNDITKTIKINVTNLITKPLFQKKKSKLPCGRYSKEENEVLDNYLKYKIQESGYQTRAGVVTALRFLTLQFPYQISYFFENGRLNNNTGGNFVDGEGRFYHQGLYLNSAKFSELKKVKYGPSIWGCPLTNWQDEAGFIPGKKYPNGLDCSGFIS